MRSKRVFKLAGTFVFSLIFAVAAAFGQEDPELQVSRVPQVAQDTQASAQPSQEPKDAQAAPQISPETEAMQEQPEPAAPPAQRTSVIGVFGEYVTGFPFSFNGLTGRGALSGFDYTKFRDGTQSGWSAGVKRSFFSPQGGGAEGSAWGFGFQVISLGVNQVLMEEEAVFGTLTQRPLLFGAFFEGSLETFSDRDDNGFFLWMGAAAGTSRNSFRKGAFLEEIEAATGTVFEITADNNLLLCLGMGFRFILNPFYVNCDFRVLWAASEHLPTTWTLHGGSASLLFEDFDKFNADTISLTITLGVHLGLIRKSR